MRVCEIFRGCRILSVSNSAFLRRGFSRTRVHISSILPWRRDAKYSSSKQCMLRGVRRRRRKEGEDGVEESETKRGRIGEGETLDPLLGWLPHTADLDAAPANPHTPYVNKRMGECVGNLVVHAISPLHPPSPPSLFLSLSLLDPLLSITFYISPTNPSIRHFRFVFRFFEYFYPCIPAPSFASSLCCLTWLSPPLI